MNAKRIVAIILVLILTVIPTVAVSAYTLSDSELQSVGADYTPRLTAPSTSNKYYYSNINIFYSIGYGMPNCTAYAWGRAYELLGTRPNLSVDSAHYWWDYNKTNGYYPYGQTPKLGAIACWDNPYGGHVAVVEKITSDTITMSNSGWRYKTFYLTESAVGASNGGNTQSGWTFKGYIYILDDTTEPDGDVYRVDSDNGINLRKGAGTSYSVRTSIPYAGKIVVTETKTADGYTWGKTTYNGYTGWCVLDFATLIYSKPVESTPTEPETEAPAVPDSQDPTEPETEDPSEPVATSDEIGSASPSVPDERPVDWADSNGDGKTTISDATVIQKYISGLTVEIELSKADSNGDGQVNVLDATYIQKVLANI